MEATKVIAKIRESKTSSWIALHLVKDQDSRGTRYCWRETATGADCEVSDSTIAGAIKAARVAWKAWEITIRREHES